VPKRTVRAGQLIAPFGPGAVIDLGAESLVCVDISRWPRGECPVIQDNPLRMVLGLDVRSPPSPDRAGQIPFARFPRWLFCPNCRRLYHYTAQDDRASGDAEPRCSEEACNGVTLAAMRFVAACDHGHLQDVDWYRWAHRNSQVSSTGQCSRQTAVLYFRTTGASGGDFNAMEIECSACGGRNTFEGLTQGPYVFGCAGRQPWENRRDEKCNAGARVYPRAASNVYYPQTRSAIDIDAASGEGVVDRIQGLKQWLLEQPDIGTFRGMRGLFPAGIPQQLYQRLAQEAVRKFGIDEQDALTEISRAINRPDIQCEVSPTSEPNDQSQHGILRREWAPLSRVTAVSTRNLRTTVPSIDLVWPAPFTHIFEQITLIERLREVRALIGFRRVRPDVGSIEVPVDLGAGEGWLPGVEAFGEGIFIKFREDTLASWEKSVGGIRLRKTRELSDACAKWGRNPAEVYSSPRFIALHTFAHGFIRRLAFDAGYSSASIRERIYCDLPPSPSAGVLIYTSEGDSEGSLGGLVRQGEPERLLGTIRRTMADLSWCSADPVCSELESQGIDGLNAAACHACCLVSETSCAYNNSLLDRRLLIGEGAIPGLMRTLVGAAV
jgi:hypothetical protein